MRTLLAATLLLVAAGCDTTSTEGDVQIRIENVSAVDFSDVEVGFDETSRSLGAVPAGGASAYGAFDVAYRYGYVRAETAAGPLVLQPTDYLGEELLDAGRYTFRLGVEGGDLTLTFVTD